MTGVCFCSTMPASSSCVVATRVCLRGVAALRESSTKNLLFFEGLSSRSAKLIIVVILKLQHVNNGKCFTPLEKGQSRDALIQRRFRLGSICSDKWKSDIIIKIYTVLYCSLSFLVQLPPPMTDAYRIQHEQRNSCKENNCTSCQRLSITIVIDTMSPMLQRTSGHLTNRGRSCSSILYRDA